MVETKFLNAVLDGTQVPHQPLLVITDTPAFPGLPLFREVIRRSEQAGQANVVVSLLHSPEALLGPRSSSRNVDLTGLAPEFDDDMDIGKIEKRIFDEYNDVGGRGSVFVDALDILAEDYSPSAPLRLFRSLLSKVKDVKAPSRLVLLLPALSPFLTAINPPTMSPTITILHPHPPPILTYLSRAYLTPIDSGGKYWQILDTALNRRLADDLAVKGEQGLEVGTSEEAVIVQVTVRKAVGGTKGMSRSLEALVRGEGGGWKVEPVSAIVDVEPISISQSAGSGTTSTSPSGPPKTHADLDLPFNLNLTDQQKAARMGVPLPYAHEGEGAAVDLEFDDEEDEDDEEI